MRKLRVRCTNAPLLSVVRSRSWTKRMVYILAANKSYKYPSGRRSHVIYIGTTGGGAGRPAASAVNKASVAFRELHGVKTIDVYIATCPGRKALKTWEHLEAGLLQAFRDLHYKLPVYNKKKGRPPLGNGIFNQRALHKVILQFEKLG